MNRFKEDKQSIEVNTLELDEDDNDEEEVEELESSDDDSEVDEKFEIEASFDDLTENLSNQNQVINLLSQEEEGKSRNEAEILTSAELSFDSFAPSSSSSSSSSGLPLGLNRNFQAPKMVVGSSRKEEEKKEEIPSFTASEEQLVVRVITEQKTNGSFEASAGSVRELIGFLGSPAMPSSLEGVGDAQLIWISVLVLIVLEQLYSSLKSRWELALKKTKKWIKRSCLPLDNVSDQDLLAEARSLL